MKKIILTILSLIMLTTPVMGSASFASETIPEEVIFAEAVEISKKIVSDLEPIINKAVKVLKKKGDKMSYEEKIDLLKAHEAFIVQQMRSKVEELRKEGLGNSLLARKINYCCGALIVGCNLTKKSFEDGEKLRLSAQYMSGPFEFNFGRYFKRL